jgi:hypothetical protein
MSVQANLMTSEREKASRWQFRLPSSLYATTVLAVVLGGVFAARFGAWWWTQREGFDLQAQQMATIKRLGEFPPEGQSREVWENALVTPYNVWGNVTYAPNYSNVGNQEMRSLLTDLEAIVSTTTTENSIESVDRVFQLLLRRGQKTEFISGYREEFRAYFEDARRSSVTNALDAMSHDS